MATIPVGTKFLGVDPELTNLIEKKGRPVDRKTEYFSIEDIANAASNTQPYKVYTALLTQSGTNAPVATVLENTFNETFTFTRIATGIYRIVSANNAFTTGKTFVIMQAITTFTTGNPVLNQYYNDETVLHPGYIQINTIDTSFNSAEATFALPNIIPIEIRVYN
jgi:hypothetical protein